MFSLKIEAYCGKVVQNNRMDVICSTLSLPFKSRLFSLCSPIQLHPSSTICTTRPILKPPSRFSALNARKKNSPTEPLLKPDIIQQVLYEDDDVDDENDPFIDEDDDDEFEDGI